MSQTGSKAKGMGASARIAAVRAEIRERLRERIAKLPEGDRAKLVSSASKSRNR